MSKIAVVGSGGWGTALAVMADRMGHRVVLWSAFEEEIAAIRSQGEHTKLLPGIAVSPTISLTTDMACVADADLIILAVPSFAIRDTAKTLALYVKKGALIANAGKGIEEDGCRLFSQIIEEAVPQASVVVLSGPSHAEEVGRGVPTSLVAACTNMADAERVQELLINDCLRMYTSTDVIGAQLGGALKNVIALAAGICDGLQMGDNTKAALMTRGLAEIARLGVKMGAESSTFAGLTGMGDLIVTCGSMHSRNRRAGILIGQGVSPEEAVRRVGTVEGYFAAEIACRLAEREQVPMPITEICYRICYEKYPPREAVQTLMSRPGCHEKDTVWF